MVVTPYEVLSHRLLRPLAVAALNLFEQRFMLGHARLHPLRVACELAHRPVQDRPKRLENGDEHGVARGLGDRHVELDDRGDEVGRSVVERLYPTDRLVDDEEFPEWRVDGEACGDGLNGLANLHKVAAAHRKARDVRPLHGRELFGWKGGDERPAAIPAPDVERSGQLQDLQCLPQRRTRHPELVRQLLLWRQPLPGLQVAVHNRLLDRADDQLEVPARSDRLEAMLSLISCFSRQMVNSPCTELGG